MSCKEGSDKAHCGTVDSSYPHIPVSFMQTLVLLGLRRDFRTTSLLQCAWVVPAWIKAQDNRFLTYDRRCTVVCLEVANMNTCGALPSSLHSLLLASTLLDHGRGSHTRPVISPMRSKKFAPEPKNRQPSSHSAIVEEAVVCCSTQITPAAT